ncbi:MAG: SDR family oxidoreductase [Lachnospiraceae bacterium]|nr:SDR family oxidoreductase [Lachnospiraceae bacterium]
MMRKVAFITGGTSGLGFVLLKKLLERDYEVISVSRNTEKIEKTKKRLNSDKVFFIQGDIMDEEVIDEAYQYLFNKYGYVNVVINNAAIMAGGGIEDISSEEWKKVFEVNVHVPFKIIKKMSRLLKRAESACVINVSSIASQITGGCMAYSASKAAVDMMTKSLAKELSNYYIRVNTVNPGLINTGFQIHNHMMSGREYEEYLEDSSNAYPMGIGTADDVAELICFLISEKGAWITGSNYIIDGGRSINC